MAELSLQRGDVERGRLILEKRINQGASDFKTLNLYGVALAHSQHFDNSITIFRRLLTGSPSPSERARANFNLALATFYQDLIAEGDQSVARTLMSIPGRTILPVHRPQPFNRCVEIWDSMLRQRVKQRDIIHTYLAFVCQQLGYLDHALGHLAAALSQNEGFYVTHYVLGRVFLDLFLLEAEGNSYALSRQTVTFFEIEKNEIVGEKDDRCQISRETLLDIAMQAMLDARNLSPLAPCVYLGLCEIYHYAGLIDEAFEALAHAETLAPNALGVLETSLRLHELMRGPADIIRGLLERIKLARRREAYEVYNIIPSYYML